jgi:isopentenyl phosphate kinase
MARPLVLVKLGGSLITDKARPRFARHAAIRRLARELAAVVKRPRGPRLLVGHGSGSFGHAAAARGGLIPGADATRSLDAIARTQRAAADLHRIVIAALGDAGARPFSFAPSSFLHAANARVTASLVEPIFDALDRGLLPVVYGDVVLDARRGAVIVSTEELFQLLADAAAKRRTPVARVIWLGETDGVRGGDGRRIARLSAADAKRTARRVRGASGVDVTGGMALRLRAAGALAEAGVASAIVDGRKAGAIAAAIAGRGAGGTRVDSR